MPALAPGGTRSGGSSGAAMAGVLQAAKSLKPGQRCVVIFPDSIRNYMTKFLRCVAGVCRVRSVAER